MILLQIKTNVKGLNIKLINKITNLPVNELTVAKALVEVTLRDDEKVIYVEVEGLELYDLTCWPKTIY